MKTYFGKLRLDPSVGDVELWVNGQHFMDSIDVSEHPDVALEEDLVVELYGQRLVSWAPDPRMPRAGSSSRKDIALVRVLGAGDEIEDRHHKEMRDWAKRMQDEYRRLARGQWEVTVTPYVIHNKEGGSTGLRGMDWRYMREQIKKVNPDNRHNYWHGVGGFSSTACGVAWVRGNEAWTYPACSYKTAIHEQGHNFGLGHAGSRTAQYGERTAWQGTGSQRDDSNTPHLAKLGLIEDDRIETLSDLQSGTFYIAQGTTHPLALPEGVLKQVEIRRDGTPKVLSVSYHDGRVDIHKPRTDTARTFTYTARLESLKTGERFEEFGVSVEVTSISGGVARVVINDGDDGSWVPGMTTPDENENPLLCGGLWANEDQHVQGLQVMPLPNRQQVMVSWLTWDRDYRQRWAVMVGDIDAHNVVRGTLSTADGPVGQAEMYFIDTDRAVFRAVTNLVDTHTVRIATPVERFAKGEIRFYSTGDGQGLVSLDSGGGWMTAYVLDSTINRLQARGMQRWRLAQGPKDNMKVYEVTGGMVGVAADYEMEGTGVMSIEARTVRIGGEQHELVRLA